MIGRSADKLKAVITTILLAALCVVSSAADELSAPVREALAPYVAGRVWEYRVTARTPGEAEPYSYLYQQTVLDNSLVLPDGSPAVRLHISTGDGIENLLAADREGRMLLMTVTHPLETQTLHPPPVWLGVPRVGSTWRTTYTVKNDPAGPEPVTMSGEFTNEGKIVASETVTVPAGTFPDALKVEGVTGAGSPYQEWYVRGLGIVRVRVPAMEGLEDYEAVLVRVTDPSASGTLAEVARSHVDGNVPEASEFESALAKALEAYLEPTYGNGLSVKSELLRKLPTQSGVANPKFYLWLLVTTADRAVIEGAARVAAWEKTSFDVTHFLAAPEIIARPEEVARVFPQALVEAILMRARQARR